MAKAWLYALALLLTPPATAQGVFPCPHITSGWALSWPPPLTSVTYDMESQILYVVFNYTTVYAYSHIPVGVMVSLSYTQHPVPVYNDLIAPVYEQLTLDPKTHCPV